MEETISLKELFVVMKKRLWLIITIMVLAMLTSGLISYYVLTPVYQSSTQILVNQAKDKEAAFNYNEVQTNLQLIETYNVIMKSPAILDKVIEKLDLKISSGQLNQKITVQSEQNSQVVNLAVTDEDPKLAAEIANTIADTFQDEIVKIMNVDNVSILAKAEVTENQSPIKPKPLLNIAIAMVVGLMIGIGLTFLLEYLDNTIKTEQDIEKTLGLPVIGVIGMIASNQAQFEEKAKPSKKTGRGDRVGA